MRRNRLGINTFFGLSYFVFSFFGALIPDHPRNQGHFLNSSSANRIEVSLGAMPNGQVSPKADNLSFAESPESGAGNVSFISTKPTKLPIQGTTLVPPTYPANGLKSVGMLQQEYNFLAQQSPCTTTVSASGVRKVCSGGKNQTITVSNAPPNTTYTWTVGSINNNLVGAQDQTVWQPQVRFVDAPINKTNTIQNITYNVIARFTNGCQDQPFSINVAVYPTPRIEEPQTIIVCSGKEFIYFPLHNPGSTDLASNLNSVPAGTVYDWETTRFSNGIFVNTNLIGPKENSGSPKSTITQTFTNNSNTRQEFYYTVTPYSGDNCMGTPFQLTILVDPSPTVTDQPLPSVCSDAPLGVNFNSSSSSSVATATYNVTSLVLDNGLIVSAGGAAVANGLNATALADDAFRNTTNAPKNVVYTVVPVSADGCKGASFEITVTVNPEPVVADQPLSPICNNAPLGVNFNSSSSSSVATATYNVTSLVLDNGLIVSAGGAAVANGLNATALADDAFTNTTNAPKNVVYTVVPVSAAPNSCQGNPFTVTVTINPVAQVDQPSPKTVCSGGQVAAINFGTTNTGITPTYNWTNDTQSIGLAASGIGSIGAFTGLNTTNSPVTATITVTPSIGSCNNGPSKTFTITVNPEPVVIDQTLPTPVCSDGPLGVIFNSSSSSSVATATYTIFSINTNGLIAGINNKAAGATGLLTDGITNDSFTNTTSTAKNVVYTVVPVSAAGCQGNSFTVTVTVNPKPVGIPSTPSVCSDQAFSFDPQTNITTTGGNSVTSTFAWVVSSVQGTVTGVTSGQTGTGNITGNINNVSNTAATIVYTVTPTSAAPNSCQGNPFTITLTINPEPVVANQTPTVCSDAPLGVNFNSSTSVAAATYNVTALNLNGLSVSAGGAAVANGLSAAALADDAFTNNTNAPVDVIYTVVPVSATPNSCQGNPFTVTVTVNPEPVVANQTPTVCSDAPLGVNFNSSTSVAAATYNITALDLNGLTVSAGGAAVANGLTATALADDAFTNTTNTPKNVVYTVIPVSAAGCQGNSFTVTATINPEPVVAVQTRTVCSDAPLGVNFNSSTSVAAATYNVTALNLNGLSVSAGGAAVANGLNAAALADDAFTNNTSAAVNVVYTVVPVSAAGCQGNSFTVTVTVNPKPAGISSTPSVCSDQPFSFNPQDNVTTTGGNSIPSTFAWVVSSVQGTVTGVTSGQTGTGNVAGNINNVSNTAATIVYTVTPTSAAPNSCQGNSFTITLTVNPEPVVANQTLPTVCNNAPIGINFNSSSSVAAATYNITDITLNGLTPAPTNKAKGTTNLPANGITNDSFTNTTNAALNVVYTIVPVSAAGCQGNSFTVTVTVKPPIAINETISDYGGLNIACFGDTTASISLQVSGGTAPYRYAWTGPNGFTSTSANLSNLAVGSYSLIVTDAANCRLTKTYDMRGPDPIAIAATISDYIGFQISCKGGSDGLIDLKITGGNGGYQIFWEGPAGFRSNLPKIEGLLPGKYEVTVIDSKNCSLKKEYTLLAPDEFLISPDDIKVTEVSCFNGSNGAIAVTLKKATLAPYRYEINGSSTTGLPVSKSILSNNLSYQFAGLRAGSYTLRVSDAIGCTISINTEIKEAPIYDLTETVKNVSCFGKKDGAITVRVIGGAPPFKVQWVHGPKVPSINNLDKGIYTVTITDTGGCTIEKQFVITEPQELDLSASVTDALDCADQNTGSISVNPFGGTPPYTYTWSNGSKTQNLAAIGPGSYSLEVMDAKGCRLMRQFTINHPLPLEVSVAQTTVRVCEPRGLKSNFKVTVTGGIAPYTVTWNRGTQTNAGLVMDTQELGVFVVTVKDARGCLQIKRIEVVETDPLVASFDYKSASFDLSKENLVNFEVQFKNLSVGKYKEASWDFRDGGASTEKDPTHKYSKPGTYTVQLKLKDLTDCIVTFSKEIVITDYYLKLPTAFTPNQDGVNDYFYPKFLHISAIQVTIMNKWGESVYESKDLDAKGWDGLYKGEKAPIGNYVCKVRHTTLDGRILDQTSVFYLYR